MLNRVGGITAYTYSERTASTNNPAQIVADRANSARNHCHTAQWPVRGTPKSAGRNVELEGDRSTDADPRGRSRLPFVKEDRGGITRRKEKAAWSRWPLALPLERHGSRRDRITQLRGRFRAPSGCNRAARRSICRSMNEL